jgi:hypothetical protein
LSRSASPEVRPSRNWSAERDAMNELARLGLGPSERLVLHAIVIHIASHDEGWPTQPTIARLTGLSERQVRRVVDTLVARAVLETRIVGPGGALPDGSRTESARLVYRRGPALTRPPLRKCSSAARVSNTPEAPTEAPPPSKSSGHGVRMDPDVVSGKGDQEQTKPSLPPSPERWKLAQFAKAPERVGEDQVIGGQPRRGEARAVLLHWQATLWPRLRGELETSRRLGVILTRLADGFTVEELRHVADAAKESAWHQAHPASLMADVLYDKPEMVERLAYRGRELAVARQREHAGRERLRAEEAARDREWRESQQSAMSPAEIAASARAVLASLAPNISTDAYGTSRVLNETTVTPEKPRSLSSFVTNKSAPESCAVARWIASGVRYP